MEMIVPNRTAVPECARVRGERPNWLRPLVHVVAALTITLVTTRASAYENAGLPVPGAPRDTCEACPPGGAPLVAFPTPRVRAWQVGPVRADRMEHAGLSFTLVVALAIATRSPAAAASATFTLGVAKELFDSRTPSGADALDLAADACGVAVALACVRARGR